jgi:serine/threonine protein kinase/ferredoxin/hemoglobin-like flavoprotein
MTLPAQLKHDTIIGEDFKILRRIGEGGMGVVYAAIQLTTGHERAVKIMHSPFALDVRARERFEQEARIGARIHSDHVVQVVAAGIDEASRTPWLAMEMLSGQDLERYVKTRGPLPLAEAAVVIGQIMHAIGAAHDVDVVHRDIKPENIFLSVSRVVGIPFMVKILDFGIAKLRSSVRSATVAVGTPGYMAPEQSQASDDIGPAADVWSLGLVVYRMLTGRQFWRASGEDATMPQLWRELLIDPIPKASERAAEQGCEQLLPPGFDEWFAACVEREPSLRFQHARAAGIALDQVLRAVGVVGLSSLGASHTPTPGLSAALHEVQAPPQTGVTVAMSTGLAPNLGFKVSADQQPTAPASNLGLPTHRVAFRERGERIVTLAPEGATLLDISLGAGIAHYHACGGNARCSTCRVVVVDGRDSLTPRTEAEQQIATRRKWPATTRLACQARVRGPVTVQRMVIDPNDASLTDLRRTTEGGATRSQPATVLVLRLDGIDAVLADGFPDDAIHMFERCLAPLEELLADNGGRMVGFDGTAAIAAFEAGADGVRRALRVALRVSARIRRLNPYLLKHFGAQVSTAAGLGGGMLLEGKATTQTGAGSPSRAGLVLMGAAVRDARRACDYAARGQVLARAELLEGQDLVCAEASAGLQAVLDFAKSDVVYLVQSSFDLLEGQATAFATAFYDHLFELHPAAGPLFENTDMTRQKKMLMDTIALAVRGLDDFGKIAPAVRELGERHVDYGATLKDYKFVGQALLDTLAQFLGDAFTPEAELAWREIYSTLVRTMTELD